jgi:hypothetical protein
MEAAFAAVRKTGQVQSAHAILGKRRWFAIKIGFTPTQARKCMTSPRPQDHPKSPAASPWALTNSGQSGAADRADSDRQIAELVAAGKVGPRDGFLSLTGSTRSIEARQSRFSGSRRQA